MKLNLKPPGTERLKLECDDALSNFSFNFNLRCYTVVRETTAAPFPTLTARAYTRPLFSSTLAVSDTNYTLYTL